MSHAKGCRCRNCVLSENNRLRGLIKTLTTSQKMTFSSAVYLCEKCRKTSNQVYTTNEGFLCQACLVEKGMR